MSSWQAVALLAEPARRAVYDSLGPTEELTREQVADRAGLSAGLAGHHLGRLVEAGLLERRPGIADGREGRPPARYRQGPAVQLPGRRPALLVDLLAAGRPDLTRVCSAARAQGLLATPGTGTARARVLRALDVLGFAPRAGRGRVDSGGCPFVARELADPEVACSVALGLAEGVAEGAGAGQVERVVGGPCCVRVVLPR